jgi:Na+-translocating ferredoxin:NAD+ oxidoreductase RnfG subunit
VLKALFPSAERIRYVEVQQAALAAVLPGAAARPRYHVFVAQRGDEVQGYAVIDDEQGQHEPITFVFAFDGTGALRTSKVLVYREAYGHEIKDPRFLAQFSGKRRADPLQVGKDIDGITGATISARSTTRAARRALALVDIARAREAPTAAVTSPAEVSVAAATMPASAPTPLAQGAPAPVSTATGATAP